MDLFVPLSRHSGWFEYLLNFLQHKQKYVNGNEEENNEEDCTNEAVKRNRGNKK